MNAGRVFYAINRIMKEITACFMPLGVVIEAFGEMMERR